MNKNNQKIIYDKESRVLSIEVKKAKSVDSDISGNAVIDYDAEGGVVRINLYNFSFDGFRSGIKSLKMFAQNSGIPFQAR